MAAAMIAARSVAALAGGIIVGVALCLVIELQPFSFFALHLTASGKWHLGANEIVGITIITASEFGVFIAILSIPVWLFLGLFQRQTAATSALLGFLMTAATYFFTFGGMRIEDMADATIFGVLGALSGCVVWWVNSALQSNMRYRRN